MKKIIALFLPLLLFVSAVAAQTECPASILLMLARAGAVCNGLERNMICYGNGDVSATFYGGDAPFEKPGDQRALDDIQTVSTGAEDWGVTMLQVQASLPDSQQRSVTFLLFGTNTLVNHVPPTPTITLVSGGTVNIRAQPALNGEIVARVGIRGSIIANGRTADGAWLRVMVPDDGAIGWVSVDAPISLSADAGQLTVAEADASFLRPFQDFTLLAGGDDALCEGAPRSGLLLQTPNTVDFVDFVMNGVTLKAAGTLFIHDELTIAVLDGQALVGADAAVQYVPAGAQVQLVLDEDGAAVGPPGSAEPYDEAALTGLPVNNLTYRFTIPSALDQAEIEAQTAAFFTPAATPIPPEERERNQCRRETLRAATLRAGPGLFYEGINEIAAGTILRPVLAARDADGVVWWQLPNSNWILANAVETSGPCAEVPFSNVVPPPRTNTLSLETCETTNGQLRAGQQVTITFLPPAWETLADAQAAPRIDPGQIRVNGRYLRISASAPVRIAEARYVRTFSAVWTAEAGSHRIEAERLSYVAICNLTVPVG
ncbi:MAG: SH3 domain-containing protein [Anaerolineae bacterium]|nr:SH3 domain-containing protein [Anaerolineae bacterium]